MQTLFSTSTAKPLELRYYQREAIEAAYDHFRSRKDNPCIVLPTGAGKTPVLASIANDVVTRWNGRVLVLAHVKELVEQTAETLASWFPSLKVGVYSAGLGRRETKADVLVASIQSVHKKGLKLAGTNPPKLVMVDEAHRIPTAGDGMYRNLLKDLQIASPATRVLGLTATPYRLKGGWVCGQKNFLNHICYEAGVRELIGKGYLCPLVSKQPRGAVDESTLKIRGSEFDLGSLSEAFDSESVVEMAVAEIAEQTADRSSVLVFCCNVKHAEHVAESIEELTGQLCGIITGDQASGQRDQTIQDFKSGRLKYLANVNVLTEGFDARRVDCVALLRSTLSAGLYYQMVGRGLRTHDDKIDCLVLDFGGNVLRHGCIDNIKVKSPKTGIAGDSPSRVCSECQEIVAAYFRACPACGFEFPKKEESGPNHEATADDAPITSDQLKATVYDIDDVSYYEHIKRGADDDAPRTMRVMYHEGLQLRAQEWVCVEHGGVAGQRAEDWWSHRTDSDMPSSAADAARLGSLGYLAEPKKIAVLKPPGERFSTITKYWLGPKAEPGSIETEINEWGEEVPVENDDDDGDEVPF